MRYLIAFLLFLPAGFTGAQTTATATAYDFNRLSSFIDQARQQWHVPGLAIGIVHQNKVVFAKGFGNLEQDKPATVNEHTQFGIASNTKAFTAMGIAILAGQGKLGLHDKVTKHLPWFKAYNDYVTGEMTVRDLLTHRSGLRTFSGDLIWYASNHTREEVVRRSQYLTPGTGFREQSGYSNIHYLAAGLIIEKVSGMSYDAFLAQYIFKPLGMDKTNSTIRENPKDNVASPHAQKDDVNIPIPYVNWDNIAPAGSINSSVSDMCKWITALLNKGKYADGKIIDEKDFALLLQPVTAVPVSRFGQKMHPSKHLSTYGCGFNLFDYHGALVVNHSGGLDGMVSHLAFVPEKEFGFVILCNAGSALPGVMLYDVLDFMMREQAMDYCTKYNALIKQNAEAGKAEETKKWQDAKTGVKPPLDPEAYIGLYTGDVYGGVTVTEQKGKLSFALDHSPTFHAELHYWKDNLFWFEFAEHPSLPRGTVQFVTAEKAIKPHKILIDCPNPDFDFTELDLIRESK